MARRQQHWHRKRSRVAAVSPMKVQEMAAAREGNADDGGGSSVDDRWQRKIDMVEASSIMQAAMLTAIEGEKGDCGSGRSDCGIAATTVIEVKVIRLLWSLGKEMREVAAPEGVLTALDKARTEDGSAGSVSRGRMATWKREGRRAVAAAFVTTSGEDEMRVALMARLYGDEYGLWRKMKKLREVAATGSTMRKGSKSEGMEESNDDASVATIATIAASRSLLWFAKGNVDCCSRSLGDMHQLTRVRLIIVAVKMVTNCSKVAKMTAKEDSAVGNYDRRLRGSCNDSIS
ncbi:hypothetical protein B296_00009293 [Ensete ventricosum]|uniref:Uncharacterized protein n=1 Tax=Ensete ventricosum TaxID=4639 RepID=A0A426ZR75_ENSVE|nr:hypothetical protein B296_00009293 [Ensete ventricosum]